MQVVEVLVVLIVCKADGGAAHFADQLDILFVMLGKQGITQTPTVLMAADTAQGILFAVEDKAVFRINLKAAAAEAGGNGIQNFITLNQFGLHGVQVGILPAMPQVCILDAEDDLLIGSVLGAQSFAVLVEQGVADDLAFLGIGQENLNLGLGITTLHDGRDLDAGAAVVVQIKVGLRNGDDVDVTVQTAVEGEVCHLGIDAVVGSIVNGDDQQIFISQSFGQVHAPGGVTAIVVSQVLTVQIHISGGVGTIDFQVVALCRRQVCLGDGLCVVSGAAPVVVAAVLTVYSIPAVGDVDCFPVGTQRFGDCGCFLGEEPALVDAYDISHDN